MIFHPWSLEPGCFSSGSISAEASAALLKAPLSTVFVRSRRLGGIRSGGFQFPAVRDGRVGETHPEAKVNAGEVEREEGGNVVFPHCS